MTTLDDFYGDSFEKKHKNTKIFLLNIGGLPHYNTNNAEELYNNISNSDIYILCFAHTNLN